MMNYDPRQLQQLMNDPQGAAEKAGFKIPAEMMGNPKEMVMHLINSGQVQGPVLQRIMPMIRMMGK